LYLDSELNRNVPNEDGGVDLTFNGRSDAGKINPTLNETNNSTNLKVSNNIHRRPHNHSSRHKNHTVAPTDQVNSESHQKSNTAAHQTTHINHIMSPALPPDSNIDSATALAYWSSTEPTVNGVLGGFPQVSRIDLQGSSNFLGKLRRASKSHPPTTGKLARAADCGAGIGRITTGFLSKVAEVVDVIEPVREFTDVLKAGEDGVGEILNVGLEGWQPTHTYDLVWNQWCVGQLTDAQFVAYLKLVTTKLSPGGWIVVKENLSNNHLGEDVYDETDSSVTRTDEKFRQLFKDAALKVVASELQRGMPKGLYDVRSYALQPM
jgi:protein N-terminal methyltransferase